MTLCVYAVVARPGGREMRLTARGASGERLQFVGGPVAAVVGEVARLPAPSPDVLRRYEGTVATLAARLPAVLPARFGTSFATHDDLRYALRARHRALRLALTHVRHRVQMTVRVVSPADTVPVPGDPPPGAAGSGREYLHERARARARAREVPGFGPVREAVARWVRDERVEKRVRITTVYHLIPRASAERYAAAVTRAAAAAGLQVVVSGPWAPYAFTEN